MYRGVSGQQTAIYKTLRESLKIPLRILFHGAVCLLYKSVITESQDVYCRSSRSLHLTYSASVHSLDKCVYIRSVLYSLLSEDYLSCWEQGDFSPAQQFHRLHSYDIDNALISSARNPLLSLHGKVCLSVLRTKISVTNLFECVFVNGGESWEIPVTMFLRLHLKVVQFQTPHFCLWQKQHTFCICHIAAACGVKLKFCKWTLIIFLCCQIRSVWQRQLLWQQDTQLYSKSWVITEFVQLWQNSICATLASAFEWSANVLPGLWDTEEGKMHQSQILNG